MKSDRKLANTVGGKSARACDNCIKKRARWYCAADDAFLCQGCDASVHSANTLARRHDRLRLKTCSINNNNYLAEEAAHAPSWHRGFTRKARTPRFKKNNNTKESSSSVVGNPSIVVHLVPELCSDETSHEEDNEERLLYRVPSFEDPNNNYEAENNNTIMISNDEDSKSMQFDFVPSEMELAEFAADVETLLGRGLDDEAFDMEGLGLLGCRDKEEEDEFIMGCSSLGMDDNNDGQVVKVEDDDEFCVGQFDLNHFNDTACLVTCEEGNYDVMNGDYNNNVFIKGSSSSSSSSSGELFGENKKKVILLRLDLDGVITAWDEQKSPWTNGQRPNLESDECWPYCMGNCGRVHTNYNTNKFGENGIIMGHASSAMLDGGREARVSRYREKRRTRLFSKKIRYEVRKLNAEKRPRMKGRFVKRANFPTSSAFPLA